MYELAEKRQVPAHPGVRFPVHQHRFPRHHAVTIDASPRDEVVRRRLDRCIISFFFDAVRVALFRPRWWVTALRLFIHQKKSIQKRMMWHKQNVHVPPFIILSVTDTCNLRCAGCYANALHYKSKGSISSDRLVEILSEARTLGVSSVLVTGGEPLIRSDVLQITSRFPELTFALFTNGTLVNDEVIRSLRDQRHVVPVLSIEGDRNETDSRRGEGVYSRIESTMASLKKNGLFFGCSVTVTTSNFSIATSEEWIKKLYNNGCRLFVFVEYVSVAHHSEHLVLSQAQRQSLMAAADRLRKTYRALFLAFPGDEALFGGCLAAGRGFVYISPSGDLEPCPFAPYADRNVNETSLKRALRSPLLETIRANHAHLDETSGGCALWRERDWVASLVGQQAGTVRLPDVRDNAKNDKEYLET